MTHYSRQELILTAIARLAAITGIRTFLNFFLQKEVRELEAMNQQIRENSGL